MFENANASAMVIVYLHAPVTVCSLYNIGNSVPQLKVSKGLLYYIGDSVGLDSNKVSITCNINAPVCRRQTV